MECPFWILLADCCNPSELLLSSPHDLWKCPHHQFGLWCASHLGHTNSSLLILRRWCVNWKVLYLCVVQVHYSCLFTVMKQKYLLAASVFYLWMLIVSSPSTNCPASSLMTHLIYFRNATVEKGKTLPSCSWGEMLLSLVQGLRKKPKAQPNKTKEGPPCFDVANSVC